MGLDNAMMIIVAGQFDDQGGRPSGYARKVFGDEITINLDNVGWQFINGGTFEQLLKIDPTQYNTIIWLPSIPNDKPKLVQDIKKRNPRCLLVTSKQNADGKYKPLDLIERALRTKSNLLVEFTSKDGKIAATIWDALGNTFLNESTDPNQVHDTLIERCTQLCRVKRINSTKVGDTESVPDQPKFFQISRSYANSLHRLVHAVNTERFVGNLSFRCENGFPSFRCGERIYVSRRNIDKREITADGFVPIKFNPAIIVPNNLQSPVQYFGDHKPSVDSPIQLLLYSMFPKIRYMIHCHAYIEDGEYTNKVLPCGDIREAIEIKKVVAARTGEKISHVNFFAVNLLGHGSIVGAHDINRLRRLPYIARQLPEHQKC